MKFLLLPKQHLGDSDLSTALSTLIPALFTAFSVILVGYASVKLNVVSPLHKQGLSVFVTKMALPALLFSGMSTLDFSLISWYFLLAVAIGKLFVFLVALSLTMLLAIGKPQVLGTAGVHAIFVSQSNDFALGIPIFEGIFSSSHPEYESYLYLVAPISLLILNPIGFFLMEKSRDLLFSTVTNAEASVRKGLPPKHPQALPSLLSKEQRRQGSIQEEGIDNVGNAIYPREQAGLESGSTDNASDRTKQMGSVSMKADENQAANPLTRVDFEKGPDGNLALGNPEDAGKKLPGKSPSKTSIWKILYGVISSPVVFMVPLGLIANVIFDHTLPDIISGPFETFGDSFSPLSLFILGMSMAEQTEAAKGQKLKFGPFALALFLIALKNLLLPLVIMLVLINFGVSSSLVMAGLIYGSLPVTPATYFFAEEYGLCEEWMGMATVLGTFLFGPLVYAVTELTFLVIDSYTQLTADELAAAKYMAIIGGIFAVWTLGSIISENFSSSPSRRAHIVEKNLILTVAVGWAIACAASLTCSLSSSTSLMNMIRYIFHTGGQTMACVFTAIMSLICLLSHLQGTTYVEQKFLLIYSAGWIIVIIFTALPPLLTLSFPSYAANDLMTCWLPYSTPQYITTITLSSICVFTIIISISWLAKEQYAHSMRFKNIYLSDIFMSWKSNVHPQSSSFPSPPTTAISNAENSSLRRNVLLGAGRQKGESRVPLLSPDNWEDGSFRYSKSSSLPSVGKERRLSSALSMDADQPHDPQERPSIVMTSWKERSHDHERKNQLLFCAYSTCSMLVCITICAISLWNSGLDACATIEGLLLLFHFFLAYGQGIVLFFSFGLYSGLLVPLVVMREKILAYQIKAMAEGYFKLFTWQHVLVGGGARDLEHEYGSRFPEVAHLIESNTDLIGNRRTRDFGNSSDFNSNNVNNYVTILQSQSMGDEEVVEVNEDTLFSHP